MRCPNEPGRNPLKVLQPVARTPRVLLRGRLYVFDADAVGPVDERDPQFPEGHGIEREDNALRLQGIRRRVQIRRAETQMVNRPALCRRLFFSGPLDHDQDIAVVHDVGLETGEDGTITHFMVQEYFEELKQRVPAGRQ